MFVDLLKKVADYYFWRCDFLWQLELEKGRGIDLVIPDWFMVETMCHVA